MPGRGNNAHQMKKFKQLQKKKQEQWRFSPIGFAKLKSPISEQPTQITGRRYPTPPRLSPFQAAAIDIPRMSPLPPQSPINNT
jgi:hypothetical protein